MIDIRPARAADAVLLAPMPDAAIRATYGPIAPPAVYKVVIAHTCMPDAIEAAGPGSGHFLVAEPDPLRFIDFGDYGDGVEHHFGGNRGVAFEEPYGPDTSLLLRRAVGTT